jgi:resolvase-like protein
LQQDLPREGDRRTATGASFSKGSRPSPPGDVVTVTRIDRLARSTFDLFGIVKRIVDAKARFRSVAEPWADTGTGRLMLAVLGVPMWSVTLSAPAPPKAGAALRPKESTWGGAPP